MIWLRFASFLGASLCAFNCRKMAVGALLSAKGAVRLCLLFISLRPFFFLRRSHISQHLPLARSELPEIIPRYQKAYVVCASRKARVFGLNQIILPKANWANVIRARLLFRAGQIAATVARVAYIHHTPVAGTPARTTGLGAVSSFHALSARFTAGLGSRATN